MNDLITYMKNDDFKKFKNTLEFDEDIVTSRKKLNALMSSILLKKDKYSLYLIDFNKDTKYINRKIEINNRVYDVVSLCIICSNKKILKKLLETKVYKVKNVNTDNLNILDLSVMYGNLDIIKMCFEYYKWPNEFVIYALTFLDENSKNRDKIISMLKPDKKNKIKCI